MVHRVVIYARVSTADQSCQRQLTELTNYIQRGEFEMVGSFMETGSGAKIDRAERKKVLELARQRKIDLVLVSELSRWGRSTVDLQSTVKRLAECNVALKRSRF
jgi:putative DNA-invertase from lambdoid prophage Rac